jgi:hypothetical protein
MDDYSVTQYSNSAKGEAKMVGFYVGGNIYARDLTQNIINLDVWSPGAPAGEEGGQPIGDTSPYMSLYPYTGRDAALFFGRDRQVEDVCKLLRERGRRFLVVYGHTGVGKTSLIAAGVGPALARKKALAFRLQDYQNPEHTLGVGLQAEAVSHDLSLVGEDGKLPPLPLLLRSAAEKMKRLIVLVLDQFELMFEPSVTKERREAFVRLLVESVRDTDESQLRIVFVARTDVLHRVGELEKSLPRILSCPYQLFPLRRKKDDEEAESEAEQAVLKPLNAVESVIGFDLNFVRKRLLPDLDEMTPSDPGYILPSHLQVVCEGLYRAARPEGRVKRVDEAVYDKLGGADAILAEFFRERLRTGLSEESRRLAPQLLAIMAASTDLWGWMKPADFGLRDVPPEEIAAVLNDLIRADILLRAYDPEGNPRWAFVNEIVPREVRLLAGTGEQVRDRFNAGDELDRVWNTWVSLKKFATQEQLRYLTTSGGHLKPRAVKTLLLLRSAAERNEPTGHWVMRLRGTGADEEGRNLIRQLEMPEAVPATEAASVTTLMRARELLGIDEEKMPSGTNSDGADDATRPKLLKVSDGAFYRHSQPSARQTCALALDAVDPSFAAGKLEDAFRKAGGGWRELKYYAEARGALADADAELPTTGLPPTARVLARLWRARREDAREGKRVRKLTVGGAVGGGLGLGAMYVLTTTPGTDFASPLVNFVAGSFFGGILGAALSFGRALAKPLLVGGASRGPGGAPSALWDVAALGVALGTLCFGIAHMILKLSVLFNYEASFVVPYSLLSFVAGLGVCAALAFAPRPRRLANAQVWALRLTLASAAFVLVAFIIQSAWDVKEASLRLSRSVENATDMINDTEGGGLSSLSWVSIFKLFSNSPSTLALLDAALGGAAFVIGMRAGLSRAHESERAGRRDEEEGAPPGPQAKRLYEH